MKNAHGVEPTRFMKREESEYDIECCILLGPIFGADIDISSIFNKRDSCDIDNDGTHSYECHPKYKKSLFVDTAGPDETNRFSVLDYEVFTHN